MATFASFIDSAANLSVSADERTYTITGDWNWDGALDDNAFPRGEDGVTIVLSGANAKLRCSAGASGTFGGYSQPIRVVEQGNAHAYPDDNGSPASPTDCRFVGVGTSIWDNLVWVVEPRSSGNARSDFDVGRNYSGTFRGFRLIQEFATGQSTPFNHIYSSNLKLEIGENGIGYSIRNERNAHAMIIESNPNAQFAGLASDNVDIPANSRNEGGTKGSSARIVVNIPANTTFTLVGLDTATLTQSSNNSTSVCKLVDPVQIPTLTTNWNSPAGATMIIERTQRFAANTSADATGTLYAQSQASQNGEDATASIAADGTAAIRCRTHYTPYTGNNTGGTWSTAVDSYRFYAAGLHFDKWANSANASVGTSPTPLTPTLTAFTLPDGTAVSSKTSGAVETAADIINALKTYEVANPTYPNISTRLLSVSGSTAQINTGELVLSTTASNFIARSSNTITLQCDSGGVDASNGVGLLNLGSSYNAPNGTLNLINFPTTSSTGTSALINITAPISQVYAYTNAGVQLGNHTLTAAGTTGFLVPASQALANTRVGCGRAGRPPQSRNIDISAGGTFNVEFQDLAAEVDANGDALYDSTATKPAIAFTTSTNPGRATFLLGNQSYSPKGIYRALHDQFSNPLGGRYVAFGRTPLQILELGGAIPPAVFLGGDTQLRRASSSGANAAVNAFVIGGIGGSPVNEDRGPIQLGGSISTGGGGGATDLTEVNTKLDAIQASANTLQEQNEHLATSLPLTLHEPLSPLAIVTGLEGQEIIRDTEETDWPLTASGVAGNGDPEAHGVVEFDGNNSHLDYSLNRSTDSDNPDLYTDDIIVLMQIRPTSFPSSGQRPLANIGALTLSLNNSTGTTAALHLGAGPGATTTTAQVNLNAWNDLVFVFTQNPDRPNNPRIRVSINGSAQETGNLGADSTLGNSIFGPIASNTENFRLGGHGTGSQTSGFQGQARAIFVHPDNEVFGTDGWDIPTGIYWNTTNQLWQGAQLMDRVEGIAVDSIERKIDNIEEKTYTLDELGLAPWRANTSNLTSATGSIGKKLAELDNPPAASAIADAVWDEALSGHATAGSAGAALTTASSYTITTPPTAEAIATEVEDALTIPTAAQNAAAVWNSTLSSYTTAGSAGKKLTDTSTHGAPADAPEAQDIAEAVRDISLTGSASGSLGEHLSGLSNAPSVSDIWGHSLGTGEPTTGNAVRYILSGIVGNSALDDQGRVAFSTLASTPAQILRTTYGADDGDRTTEILP